MLCPAPPRLERRQYLATLSRAREPAHEHYMLGQQICLQTSHPLLCHELCRSPLLHAFLSMSLAGRLIGR
eukprot:5196733-Pleurochrysis_carterae.AAC.1